MATCGQMKPLSASLPPARRELAQAVRSWLQNTRLSLRSVRSKVLSSRSALSRLAAGQVRNPNWDVVFKLRRLAEDKNPIGTLSEKELRRLLQRVAEEGQDIAAGPAVDTVAHVGGEATAASTAGTGASLVAPVSAIDGDRRNSSMAGALWPVDELMLHLDSGRYEHAVGMLDHAGGKAPAIEAAAAIQACRDQGLTEATNTLLRAVGRRPEKIVFEVLTHLIDIGDVTDAGALARIRCAKDESARSRATISRSAVSNTHSLLK